MTISSVNNEPLDSINNVVFLYLLQRALPLTASSLTVSSIIFLGELSVKKNS